MTTSTLTVRPLATSGDVDLFHQLAANAFLDNPAPDAAAHWRRRLEEMPGFQPEFLRGVYRGDTLLGGHVLYDRILRIGPARLRTGCIGAVVTHPDYRHQGAAATLLHDTTVYARARGYALLLLDGIADFYHRFGYADVVNLTRHRIDRAALRALPEQPSAAYTVRAATLADAPTLLELYRRHYGACVGSFERDLATQEHRLDHRNAPVIAFDAEGHPRGYLVPDGPGQANEAAADTWTAALALLRHQERLLDEASAQAEQRSRDEGGTSDAIVWMCPPDSSTYYLLADRLPLTSETYSEPHAGWQARPASVPHLLRALVPLWEERWRGQAAPAPGDVTLCVEEEAYRLRLSPGGVEMEEANGTDGAAELTVEALTQLVFGYRPVSWLAARPGVRVPPRALAVLETLFPPLSAWIAGSDWF